MPAMAASLWNRTMASLLHLITHPCGPPQAGCACRPRYCTAAYVPWAVRSPGAWTFGNQLYPGGCDWSGLELGPLFRHNTEHDVYPHHDRSGCLYREAMHPRDEVSGRALAWPFGRGRSARADFAGLPIS